jgi:hypothetical protein
MGDMRDVSRSLESLRRTCKDNIKINMGETRLEGVDWINLSQDRGKFVPALLFN